MFVSERTAAAKPASHLVRTARQTALTFPLASRALRPSPRRTGEYHLRGCIGSLHSRPLNTGVADFALASARDRRFKPITYNELESLSCSVSLLHSFEECAAWDDWVVGRHGIIIRFTAGHGEFSATFLPGVAAEQGWSIKETIEHLIRKAGYQGHISSSLLSNMRVTRYQSSSHSMTHKEWLSSKDEDDSVPSAHTLSTASMTPP
ncbi:unnamed protein product [Pedinophyceae sp. YPF-701]|nr:unnamed protein product [Pedinophyceae sp. YPF-701]